MVENCQLIANLARYRLADFMTVTVNYTTIRRGVYYFQLSVPTDLRWRYESANIKKTLGTKDPKIAAPKALLLKATYDREFEGLRSGEITQPQFIDDSADQILKAYGLDPARKQLVKHEDEYGVEIFDPALERFIDDLRDKAQKAAGDEETYNRSIPDAFISEAEQKALEIYQSGQSAREGEIRLGACVDIYYRYHANPHEKLKTDGDRVFNLLKSLVGNIYLKDLTKDHIHAYKEYLLKNGSNVETTEGNKTGTVRRRLKTGSAVFNAINDHYNLKLDNPFKGINIAFEGHDVEERNPFSEGELKTVKQAIVAYMDTKAGQKNPDLRLIMGMVFDTGMRLSEATGLSLKDIHLEAAIPYVDIKEDFGRKRTVKTKHSIRKVPLVGMALWAAQEVFRLSDKDQKMAFPRYCDDAGVNGSAASNAGNAWIKSRLKEKRTFHSFRHSMNDRLLNSGCQEPIIEAICGWGDDDNMVRYYGQGYSLGVKKEALLKVVL